MGELNYLEDLKDLRIGTKRLREYKVHPEWAISYARYRHRRLRRQK